MCEVDRGGKAAYAGFNPQAHIADVIAKIAANWPASRWDELMPWNWQQEHPQIAQAA